MPKYFFLLPGIQGRWWSGGTETFLRLAKLVGEHRETEVVVYATEEPGHRSLDEVLGDEVSDQRVWIYTTGVDVPVLVHRLAGRRMIYCAQESGWRLDMPFGVPIVCTSRAVMATLAERMEGHPVYLLPNALNPDVQNQQRPRDLDVLYLTRKTTAYLRTELVPALAQRCRVEIVDRFLPRTELLELFNRSKVYLYDSRSSFADGVVEGFGIQPLEALVCGCVVVSNLAGGMSDYLEPGVNCHRLRLVLQEDIDLCLRAVRGELTVRHDGEELRRRHSEEELRRRLGLLLEEIESASIARNEATAHEIALHLSSARREAEQPLYSEIHEQREVVSALQSELQEKVGERDAVIRELQSELHAKVAERDAMIRGLQRQLQDRMSEHDLTIQDLQAQYQSRAREQHEALRAAQGALDSVLSSRSWRCTAPLRAVSRLLRRS